MILERLLGDVPVSAFMEGYYLKLPFARAAGCRGLTSLGGWATVERILARPGVDALVGREGQAAGGPGPPAPAEARRLVDAGYTVGIRHAEQHDPELAALAADFRASFRAPVDVHLYCTPAGQPGFGWHYDAEEVFVLQLEGAKEWWLRKNTVNPWPVVEAIPADQRYQREVMPLLRCELRPGDWLYIPSGYWHRTRAGTESFSLSVGLRAPSGLDAYDFLRARLLASLLWRQRLPPAGEASPQSEEDLVRRYQERFAALGQDLAALLSQEEFARAFLSAQGGGEPPGQARSGGGRGAPGAPFPR